jgi:hypothetical protein
MALRRAYPLSKEIRLTKFWVLTRAPAMHSPTNQCRKRGKAKVGGVEVRFFRESQPGGKPNTKLLEDITGDYGVSSEGLEF